MEAAESLMFFFFFFLVFVLNDQNARHNARGDAARRSIISHACSSVRSVAVSACAYHQAFTATKQCALATTTGRPRKEVLNALRLLLHWPSPLSYIYIYIYIIEIITMLIASV